MLIERFEKIIYLYPGVQEVYKYDDPSEESIIAANPNVTQGGRWAPTDCKAWQKVAIILPYRDRFHPLKLLLRRLYPMLQTQKLDYQIFVIEQVHSCGYFLQ